MWNELEAEHSRVGCRRYQHACEDSSEPLYTPEPDVVHEYIGHVPRLADPELAELNHAFGIAALRASADWGLNA